ncbi:MAG: oligogalacturonate lyase family protein [Prolixibacteraceae bacterium]
MQKPLILLKLLSLVLILLFNERAEAQNASKDVSKIDKDQKVSPIQVTAMNGRHNQLVYFTSTSLLNDDRHLIYMSDLDGNPNIFMRDMLTGKEIQLSRNTEGCLKSYVYFDGKPYRGFGKASVSVDNAHGLVYYLQGRNIMVADTLGRTRIIAQYPEGQMTAFTHVSADGTKICVPTTDERALEGDKILTGKPAYNIDQRVREEKLSSWLRVYDTKSGKEILSERVSEAWITHVQFSPVNSDYILYNNEWPSDCGIRRIWLWDGKTHIRMRDEGEGRNREDWTCHEMWERDGKAIIYHGEYKNGPAYVGRVNTDGSNRIEIPLPDGWKRYGHFTEGGAGMLVTDGYYTEPDDNLIPNAPKSGLWICFLKADWAKKQLTWIPLCRNGSSWRSQDEHPHPIFNHASNAVFFTSDKDGKRAVYKVKVPVKIIL